jgi:hypothetical protein
MADKELCKDYWNSLEKWFMGNSSISEFMFVKDPHYLSICFKTFKHQGIQLKAFIGHNPEMSSENEPSIGVYLRIPWTNKNSVSFLVFEKIKQHQNEIKESFCLELEFKEYDKTFSKPKSNSIATVKARMLNTDYENKDDWPRQHQFIYNYVIKFNDTLQNPKYGTP